MYKIVTLKAYGDFVIACNAARVLQTSIQSEPISIIAGSHVQPLAEALEIPIDRVFYISDSVSSDVPAIFDARKRGLFSALKSLINVRCQINCLHPDSDLVFDSLGWRERLIGLGRKIHGLPGFAKNIYIGYDHFFESIGYLPRSEDFPSAINISRAIIIPGARMGFRIIPRSVILNIYKELKSHGIEVKVVLLEGEKIEVSQGLATEVVPRNFSALVSSVKDSDFVVSADSLPAHLSSLLGIPAFVFTPIPAWTSYWLPKPTFLTNGMATFDDMEPFRYWLNKHLRPVFNKP